jgi:hypothetical protein
VVVVATEWFEVPAEPSGVAGGPLSGGNGPAKNAIILQVQTIFREEEIKSCLVRSEMATNVLRRTRTNVKMRSSGPSIIKKHGAHEYDQSQG